MGLGIVIGGISLYRSYALYEEEKEYNVLKGQIPDFGYDVKFAVTVDNKKQSSIPGRQDNNGKYYDVKVSCTNGTTVGEWDYNAWNVKLDDISDGSKCTLAFTGGMSKEDYQKYIEQGVSTRRNTYRGKDLTEFFTKEPEKFYKQIKEGTFDDIYVGDYIKSKTNNNVTWLVADIDNYLYTGVTELKNHHLTMIPTVPLKNASMNDTNTTKGGYYGSKMVSGCNGAYEGDSIQKCEGSILDEVYNTYIQPDFGDEHVMTYSSQLTNSVNESGVSSGWQWVNNRKLDLMSEINVYGTIVASSNFMDTGIDNMQYAIFRLKPMFKFSDMNGKQRFTSWLKNVANKSDFSLVGANGGASVYGSSFSEHGVRPRFLIG